MAETGSMLLILAVLICGVLIFQKRRGLTAPKKKNQMLTGEDLQKPDRTPAEHNSTRDELNNFLAYLLRYGQKHKCRLVVPANLQVEGKTCAATMILVGPWGALGIHCYGFGGSVGPADTGYAWQQVMNGETKSIPNPVQVIAEDNTLMRRALELGGLGELPVYGAAVFTEGHVRLAAGSGSNVFTVRDFKKWMEGDPLPKAPAPVDAVQTADYLAGLCPKAAPEETK